MLEDGEARVREACGGVVESSSLQGLYSSGERARSLDGSFGGGSRDIMGMGMGEVVGDGFLPVLASDGRVVSTDSFRRPIDMLNPLFSFFFSTTGVGRDGDRSVLKSPG